VLIPTTTTTTKRAKTTARLRRRDDDDDDDEIERSNDVSPARPQRSPFPADGG